MIRKWQKANRLCIRGMRVSTKTQGFKGMSYESQTRTSRKKKPHGSYLTVGEKRGNRALSRMRVRVEHAIAGVKRSRCVKYILRNPQPDCSENN